MKKKLYIILFAFLLSGCSLGGQSVEKRSNLLWPASLKNESIISHKYYSLSYNEEYEQASWVAYNLEKKKILGKAQRRDNFRVDPFVKTGSATLSDYKGSGYDRGHLAPAGDMKINTVAMSESFYMSNMSPQSPGFNRGIWKKLESFVRSFVLDDESCYVVTGPIFTKNMERIGSNKVAVPKYYYKVLFDYTKPIKGIGFILPAEKSKKNLSDFAVSIDRVEELTGIDFFLGLKDEIEDKIEKEYSYILWE